MIAARWLAVVTAPMAWCPGQDGGTATPSPSAATAAARVVGEVLDALVLGMQLDF